MDLQRLAGTQLVDWDRLGKLAAWASEPQSGAALQTLLAEFNVGINAGMGAANDAVFEARRAA